MMMSPAEFKTLREACGLSLPQLAKLCGVLERSVRYWESGRSRVPADAARFVRQLDEMLSTSAAQAHATIAQAQQGKAPGEMQITLLRYQSDADLHHYRPDMRPLPATAHAALLYRVATAMQEQGIPWRIVYLDTAAYEAWRADQGMPDGEATRSAWAALQV